jgi:hypothetical protein
LLVEKKDELWGKMLVGAKASLLVEMKAQKKVVNLADGTVRMLVV